MLTKEECINAFNHILHCDRDDHSYISDAYRNDFNTLHRLIKEHFYSNNARTVQNLVCEIDKLEKALDKACDILTRKAEVIDEKYEWITKKEEWREVLMKDE